MKKYTWLYPAVFLFFVISTSAQIKINTPVNTSKIILPYQIPHVENVAEKITTFKIVSRQPAVINVQPKFSVNPSSEQCALLNNITSSLNLEGTRTVATVVDLTWKTKELYNKKGFEIQRSFDDTIHFKTIAFVAAYAKASVKEKYTLKDLNDNIQPAYYRLKQIKLDSGYAYSNIVLVKGIMQFKLFPNPVSDLLYLKLQVLQNSDAAIMVFDNKAVLLIKKNISLTKDIVNIKSIAVYNLPAGMYHVKVANADSTIYDEKFIKE